MLDNWQLLLDLAFGRSSIDVHSGYFFGPVTVKLIAKLAARGLRDYKTPEIVSSKCSTVGIRVLLSPELLRLVTSDGSGNS
jgi:hypothetical protein